MDRKVYPRIIGTGSYIPEQVVKNEDFMQNTFYNKQGKPFAKSNAEIIQKFEEISAIKERRHVTDDLVTSEIGYYAALQAIEQAGVDKESIDSILVAHNFGDVTGDQKDVNFVPSLAARIKHKLRIKDPATIAEDLPFGCPGWLQGVINADYYLRAGAKERVLVIGAETLSRVSDPHDRDSMLYADGAGAVLLEKDNSPDSGIRGHHSRSYTYEEAYFLWMDKSNNSVNNGDESLYLKMKGHQLYKFALQKVPEVIDECLKQVKIPLEKIDKILLHQANGKMDQAILNALFREHSISPIPPDIMPMTISWLGNSSVATLPTLLNLLYTGQLEDHAVQPGNYLLLASIGAGLNVNALVYQV